MGEQELVNDLVGKNPWILREIENIQHAANSMQRDYYMKYLREIQTTLLNSQIKLEVPEFVTSGFGDGNLTYEGSSLATDELQPTVNYEPNKHGYPLYVGLRRMRKDINDTWLAKIKRLETRLKKTETLGAGFTDGSWYAIVPLICASPFTYTAIADLAEDKDGCKLREQAQRVAAKVVTYIKTVEDFWRTDHLTP